MDTREYPVLVLCGESGFDAALQVLRQGATEFLVKPVDREELAAAIRRIIDNALLYQRGEFYTNVLRHEAPSLLVGESAPLQRLLTELQAVAPSEATVVILGESGVGKEKVAQEIHRLSPLGRGPPGRGGLLPPCQWPPELNQFRPRKLTHPEFRISVS